MALTAALTTNTQKAGRGAAGPEFYFEVTITASGSYTTGGDTLSLVGLFPGGSKYPPMIVIITGTSGFIYQYVPGTNLSNGLMKVLVATTSGTNIPLQEHGQTTYVAGVTGDTIKALVVVRDNLA